MVAKAQVDYMDYRHMWQIVHIEPHELATVRGHG